MVETQSSEAPEKPMPEKDNSHAAKMRLFRNLTVIWALFGQMAWCLLWVGYVYSDFIKNSLMVLVVVLALPYILAGTILLRPQWGKTGRSLSTYNDVDEGITAMENWKWRLRKKRVARREARKRSKESE